jgi:hypothetical protein
VTQQLDIFSDRLHFPRARRRDPASSLEAADEIERSGRARAQAERVLAAVRCYPNSTSMELARFAKLDRYAVARRLPELRDVDLVEQVLPGEHTVPCQVSGKRVCRWRAA